MVESDYERLNRFRQRYNLRHADMPFLLRDENNEPLSPNIMGTWANRGTLSRSIPLISDTFFLSMDYLMGKTDVKWRADLLKAQEDTRAWARNIDTSTMTIAQRFAAVWEHWQTLLPMREEIWAVLTYMAEFLTAKQDVVPVHTSTWFACKQNDYQPGRVQIEGAAELTGLPLRWWYTGNTALIRKFTEEELTILENIIVEPGFSVYDAKAAMSEYAKANV